MRVENYLFAIEETENKYPYRVRIVKDGEIAGYSVHMKSYDEAKKARLQIRDEIMEKEVNGDTYLQKTVNYLESNGFNTKVVGQTGNEGIRVTKQGMDFILERSEFKDVKGIKMYFDIIKDVVNHWKINRMSSIPISTTVAI